jgi:hypothetical protein
MQLSDGLGQSQIPLTGGEQCILTLAPFARLNRESFLLSLTASGTALFAGPSWGERSLNCGDYPFLRLPVGRSI